MSLFQFRWIQISSLIGFSFFYKFYKFIRFALAHIFCFYSSAHHVPISCSDCHTNCSIFVHIPPLHFRFQFKRNALINADDHDHHDNDDDDDDGGMIYVLSTFVRSKIFSTLHFMTVSIIYYFNAFSNDDGDDDDVGSLWFITFNCRWPKWKISYFSMRILKKERLKKKAR